MADEAIYEALAVLTKKRLIELARSFDLGPVSALKKAELVETLARARRASPRAILEQLRGRELAAVCAALGFGGGGGYAKAELVERILAGGSPPSSSGGRKRVRHAGTLSSIELRHVGPAARMSVEFAPRLNFFAGDNGLGKSFLLDIAWWALTRTWARGVALPHEPPARPSITYRGVSSSRRIYKHESKFDRQAEHWPYRPGRPSVPGLVLYAQVDGGFSVWDPARNYWKGDDPDRPPAYIFSAAEVWNGLPMDEPAKLCNGLIADWATWQLEGGEAFAQLRRVLHALSATGEEQLEPGKLKRISLHDSRHHPTIAMPYGRDVPLIHASAGVRRIVALAYLLVWTWQEHATASKLLGTEPAREIIFLVDEIEAHLHPRWQRRIVPALLEVMQALTNTASVDGVQLIAATHSPLVLASVEPYFDEARDAVFHFGMREGEVIVERVPWAKQGDVVNWLVSETFGLSQGRSLEAEQAIEAAEAFMRGDLDELPEGLDTKARIHAALLHTLPDHDTFWPRWVVWVEDAAS